MKKFLASILCLALVVTLCACTKAELVSSVGDAAINSEETNITTSVEEQSSSEKEIASVAPSADDKSSSSSKPSSTGKPSKPAVSSNIISSKPQTNPVKKTPAQLIVGKWCGSLDMASMLSEQGMSVDSGQIVSCDMEFTSGEAVYEVIDRNSLKTVYTNVFTKVLNDTLAENNLTKEQYEAGVGMSYDEYLAQLTQTAMDMIPKTIISTYKFKGDDLYIREQDDEDFKKVQYSFNGDNKLTLIEDGISVTYTRIS